jgi:hypothetical protein
VKCGPETTSPSISIVCVDAVKPAITQQRGHRCRHAADVAALERKRQTFDDRRRRAAIRDPQRFDQQQRAHRVHDPEV